MAELSLREQLTQKLKEGMIKDFNELYVKEFTTEWKLERWCRKIELNLMTVDNSVDSIISLMLAKVDKVKNPYFNRGGYDDTASSVGFNEALQAIKSILEGK